MSTIKRAAVAVVAVAAPAVPSATAAPAYKCASSTKDIDDTSYDGPWPDNWKVTVRRCAARSGGTVYAYAEVRWDGASFHLVDDPTIFDGAKLRVQIKQSREGTDPVVAERVSPAGGAAGGQHVQPGTHWHLPDRDHQPPGRRGRARRLGAVPGLARRRAGPPTPRLHRVPDCLNNLFLNPRTWVPGNHHGLGGHRCSDYRNENTSGAWQTTCAARWSRAPVGVRFKVHRTVHANVHHASWPILLDCHGVALLPRTRSLRNCRWPSRNPSAKSERGEKSAVSVILRSDCSMDSLRSEWVASG